MTAASLKHIRFANWPLAVRIFVAVLGALVVAFCGFLALANWNALRGPVSTVASRIVGRAIAIDGNLRVNALSWTPSIEVEGLKVGDPEWARRRDLAWATDQKDFATISKARAELELAPLFAGDLALRRLSLSGAEIALIRDAQGEANWRGAPERRGKPLKLPFVRNFEANDVRVNMEDAKRSLQLEADVTTGEREGVRNAQAFRLEGEGSINRRPFRLTFVGGALLNARRNDAYPFDAEIAAGPTTIHIDGTLRRAFDFSSYQTNVEARGADLADLFPLTGLALPNTPPFDLKGKLNRTSRGYELLGVSGRVGDSDLSGDLRSHTRNDRPFIDAAFRSESLDFDDLAAVLGGPPSVERGETANVEQQREARTLRAQQRLLPDAPLDLKRVRSLDARLRYQAKSIRSDKLPVRAGSLVLHLDNGVLRFAPIDLALTQGRLVGPLKIDASKDTPDVDVDLRLSGARVEQLLASSGDAAIVGTLSARATLRGQGRSVRAAVDSADGRMTAVIDRGEFREALAELTGINVTKGLGLLITGDKSRTAIRCGVAAFDVADGVATPTTLIVDTEDVLITGAGRIDLGKEKLALDLQGKPKEPRLVRIVAPIELRGPLRSPKIGVDTVGAIKQGGAAAALGVLLSPLAAVVPFLDAGLARDADCEALRARA